MTLRLVPPAPPILEPADVADTGTCDWGNCWAEAEFLRLDVDGDVWLPVCAEHNRNAEPAESMPLPEAWARPPVVDVRSRLL